jgi:RNA polymerase sigma-70 factor (ECF subfamily)
MTAATATPIQRCLDQLRAGDRSARAALLGASRQRLIIMTRQMLNRYPGVRRWEETDDVVQNVLLRLDRCLAEVSLESTRDFLNLAAAQIRRELIDLARHYFGPLGIGAKHATPDAPASGEGVAAQAAAGSSDDPGRLARWSEMHERIAALPPEDREMFALLWYHGMAQAEAAALLGVSVRTVKRRWQAARLQLAEALGGEPPL